MKRINDFIGKSTVGEKTSEMERVMKENMTVLKKQIDKQKMKIISLNSKMKSLNKMEHLPERKIVKRSVATTQTIENFYNEDQLMTIYKKLNESKETGRIFNEKNKQLEVEKEIMQNKLENLTVLKNKYQEESLDKTKIISDLQGVQAHMLELEKKNKKITAERNAANLKAREFEEEYKAAQDQVIKLKDLNQTMHKTLMVEDSDIDDSCRRPCNRSPAPEGNLLPDPGEPAAQVPSQGARGAGHGPFFRVQDRRALEERLDPEEQQDRAPRKRGPREGARR